VAGSFRKCKWCGGIFTFMGNKFCPNCIKKMDENFGIVRKFIYENPNAGVSDVAEETGVEEEMILHFLREGRLEMKIADGSLKCEKCGVPIATGRLCHKCSQGLVNNLESTIPKPPNLEKPHMSVSSKSKLHVDVTKGKEG